MKNTSSTIVLIACALCVSCGGDSGGTDTGGPNGGSAPPAPTSVAVAPGAQSIEVTWNAVAGADRYHVYWSDSSGVSASSNRVSNVTSPATIGGLAADTAYFVRVSAENAQGEGPLSAEVSVTTLIAAPGPVGPVSLVAGDAEIGVSWAPVPTASGYDVFWADTAGAGRAANVATTTDTGYLLNGLTNDTTYYITVAARNAGGDGPLSAEVAATPSATPANGWTTQTLINTPYDFFGRDNHLGGAAISDSGVAAVGWIFDGGEDSNSYVVVNHTAGGGWGAETVLTSGGSSSVAVAVTPAGDVFVAWVQYSLDGSGFRTSATIESRQYRNGAWTNVETLADVVAGSGVYAGSLALVADGGNNVVAAWTEDSRTVWTNRYAAGSGWQGATLISTSIRNAFPPALAANAADEVLLVWLQDTEAYDPGQTAGGPSKPVVYASRYDGAGWSAATALGHTDIQGYEGAERLRIDANPLGSAVVVWQQTRDLTGDTRYRIDSMRYDAATGGWSAPVTIVDRDWQTSWPDVAIDAGGRAIASWQPTVLADGSKRNLDASFFDPGAGNWSAPFTVNVDDPNAAEPDPLLVEMTQNGDVFAVWPLPNAGLQFRRYDQAGGSWGPISSLGSRLGLTTRLAMSPNGHALVVTNPLVVARTTFEHTVYASIYTP